MSTISASTTSTTAYKVTADTTGTLVLQTGSSPTTAVTIGTNQVATFAQAPVLPSGSIPQAALAANVAGNGPTFAYYQSVQQTGISANTLTKITFTSSLFDTTGGMYSSSRFTPTVAGYYQINFSVQIPYANPNASIIASIVKNGVQIVGGSASTGGNSLYPNSSGSGVVYLNGSTDYAEIYVYGSQAGTSYNIQTGQERTFFSAAMIRGA